jgi:hypothetical protein
MVVNKSDHPIEDNKNRIGKSNKEKISIWGSMAI